MVWFHGRYKTHKYEDCKDFINKNWEEILNTNPSDIPFNILTNSCKLKKVGSSGYITDIQLDAIKHLLEIKYLLKNKDPNYERKKLEIINRFKRDNDLSSFNTTNLNNEEGIELHSLSSTTINGGKKRKTNKKIKRKTKRRKSKKCFSLF